MTFSNKASHKRTISSPPEYSRTDNHPAASTSRAASLEDVIPETHNHRTLVLCFDGTGDQFDDNNSNVVNLFSMLKKDDASQQLVYYQAGIGTYTIPQIARPWLTKLHQILDMMLGHHLDAHVMSGYEFLMQNYSIGDKICIFGFSRGAYTARALAGMIHKVGLLPRHNLQQVPFAYKMYSREDDTGWRLSSNFKKSFSMDVDIEFLGLWDTVASIGIVNRRLPFTSSNSSIKYFRHALSLDEHRARFVPSLWEHELPDHEHPSVRLGVQKGTMPKSKPKQKDPETSPERPPKLKPENTRQSSIDKNLNDYEEEFDSSSRSDSSSCSGPLTDVEEVWFSGCHCDVGGGAVTNETRHSLARISLRWMIRECFKAKTGILFHRELLWKAGLDPDSLSRFCEPPPAPESNQSTSDSEAGSATPSSPITQTTPQKKPFLDDFISEEDEDRKDALTEMNDMLKLSRGWWILEVLPQEIKYLKTDPDHRKDRTGGSKNGWNWDYKICWANLGRARYLPHKHLGGIKVHRTVKIRMEAEAHELAERKKYVPRPKWNFKPLWVE